MTPKEQAELRHEVASARLGVAEDVGGVAAVLLGWAMQSSFHTWWLSVPAAIGLYVFIRAPYNKAHDTTLRDWQGMPDDFSDSNTW